MFTKKIYVVNVVRKIVMNVVLQNMVVNVTNVAVFVVVTVNAVNNDVLDASQ